MCIRFFKGPQRNWEGPRKSQWSVHLENKKKTWRMWMKRESRPTASTALLTLWNWEGVETVWWFVKCHPHYTAWAKSKFQATEIPTWEKLYNHTNHIHSKLISLNHPTTEWNYLIGFVSSLVGFSGWLMVRCAPPQLASCHINSAAQSSFLWPAFPTQAIYPRWK